MSSQPGNVVQYEYQDSSICFQPDEPQESIGDDHLNMGVYYKQLATYICNCATPITIAIQGSWGTGKSTLMKFVEKDMKSHRRIECIPVNTWLYDSVGTQENLPVAIMSDILCKLEGNNKSKLRLAASSIWNFIVKYKVTIIGGIIAVPSFLSNFFNLLSSDNPDLGLGKLAALFYIPVAVWDIYRNFRRSDLFRSLTKEAIIEKTPVEKVRERLEKATDECRKELAKEPDTVEARIVFFVDDLDRLAPETAVSVLEVFKNLLSLPGCVFVLATDFDVIKQGIKAKYQDMDDAKRRQFFEKIIQVPFVLPASQYPIKDYVLSLTKKQRPHSSDNENEAFEETVVKLIELLLGKQSSSASVSPRQIKRAFNRYGLYHALLSAPEPNTQENGTPGKQHAQNEGPTLLEWTSSAELELFAMQLIQMVDDVDSSEGEVTRYTVIVKSICDECHKGENGEGVTEGYLKKLFHDIFNRDGDGPEDDINQSNDDPKVANATGAKREVPNVGDELLVTLGLVKDTPHNEGTQKGRDSGSSSLTDDPQHSKNILLDGDVDNFVNLIKALGIYANTENTDTTLRGRLENLYPTIWDILQRHCPRYESDSKRLGDGGHLWFYIDPDGQNLVCKVGYGLPKEGKPSWFSFAFYNLTEHQLSCLEQLRIRKYDAIVVYPAKLTNKNGIFVNTVLSNRSDGDPQAAVALANTIEQLLDAAPILQNTSPDGQ